MTDKEQSYRIYIQIREDRCVPAWQEVIGGYRTLPLCAGRSLNLEEEGRGEEGRRRRSRHCSSEQCRSLCLSRIYRIYIH